jgi:hypothetical protein
MRDGSLRGEQEQEMSSKMSVASRARRMFLVRSAALLAAGAAQSAVAQGSDSQVSLADFGGHEGAASTAIISAFYAAFEYLKQRGGGTLTIAPGKYDLGTYSEGLYLVGIKDLENVEILGYGATLELTTASNALPTVPVFFRLENPSNVSFRGLSFFGHGTDLTVHYRGPVCLELVCTRPCSRISTIDCVADQVVAFVRSFGGGSFKYLLTDCDFSGTVRNSYYGVTIKYNGRFSRCNLDCFAVRRGFICYDPMDWAITMRCTSFENAHGSNGFISLITYSGGTSENCEVNLAASGNLGAYSALIHFYHQAVGEIEYIRDFTASAELVSVIGRPTVFLFDHALEAGVVPITSRTYQRITLIGSITGAFMGTILENPSVSVGDGNEIKVSSRLVKAADLSLLPPYITSFTPS